MNFHKRYGSTRLTALVSLSLTSAAVVAGPVGPQVVNGAVSIYQSLGTLTVNQTSNRAIVNWQGFSIPAGEAARFNLPSASSAILNRVVSGDPSAIYGTLSSNGQVFLINPNGIVVGPSGVINVGSFVASTRDVSNSDFMSGGALKFNGNSPAPVINLGNIVAQSGDAVLLAARVENSGTVTAPLGVAAFVAGNQVYYAPDAASRVVVLSGVAPSQTATGVDNSGTIRAAQVELRSVGGNPYTIAINNTGLISANKVENVGGRILLSGGGGKTQVAGTLTARANTSGGEIDVLGREVTLASGAVLDASGAQGGGKIRVGGDYQGGNSDIQNAENTTVESGVRLNADATVQSDGGQVIVWADGNTSYRGAISARGGAQGGNGGLAEVSGKTTLDFRGTVDLRAPRGATGTLLLDPTDITIGKGGVSSTTATSSYIELATLEAALAGANVTVSTSSAAGGSGDITIASTMANSTVGAVNSLTLQSDRDILINGPLLVFAPTSNPPVPPKLTVLAGRNLTIAPNMNSLGMGGAAVGGEGGLTLVAANKLPWGRLTIGANSNLATQFELTGGAGGPIRVFAAGPDTTILTGWTSAANKPSTIGKAFGDAGTAATGIYYKASTTPVEVVAVTYADIAALAIASGIVPLTSGILVSIPNPPSETNPFIAGQTQSIFETMTAAAKASNYTSYFSPEIDALIVAAGLQLPRWGLVASSGSSYTQALLAYVTAIGNKAPSTRTAAEQKIYDYVSSAILMVKVSDLPLKLAPIQQKLDAANANVATLQSELKAVGEKYEAMQTGMTLLFGDGTGSLGNNGQISTSAGLLYQMNELSNTIANRQALVTQLTTEKNALLQQGVVNTSVNQLDGAAASLALSNYFGIMTTLHAANAR